MIWIRSLCMAAVLVAGCSTSAGTVATSSAILLHAEYRSGGDVPIGFYLTIHEDGRVRYYSPRWRTYWESIDQQELERLASMLSSAELRSELQDLISSGDASACCDTREIRLSFGEYRVTLDPERIQQRRDESGVDGLLTLLNQIGQKCFKRQYMSFPSGSGGRR